MTKIAGTVTGIGSLLAAGSLALAQAQKPAPPPPPAPPAAPAVPVAQGSAAAMPMPAGPPKPPPEMDQIKMFVGSWKCEGKGVMGPGMPEMPIKAAVKVKPVLDGMWQQVDYEMKMKKTKEMPVTPKGTGMTGYDPTTKRFVRTFAGNFGDYESGVTSPGWEGDKMVWSGDINNMMGEKLQFRHTFTKKSDREFTEKYETNAKGTWTTWGESTCKK